MRLKSLVLLILLFVNTPVFAQSVDTAWVRSFNGHSSGQVSVTWDGKDNSGNKVASGIYLYKVKASDFTFTRKMVLIK